jgi:putrescine carbamoyltransferase
LCNAATAGRYAVIELIERGYQMKKDYIDVRDFSREELETLIELSAVVKRAQKAGAVPDLLYKRSVAMIFEEASTRTRISFEAALTLLGGHGIYIRPGDIHLGKRESIGDTSQVISRMCDGIVIRALRYKDIAEMARYASVPVINAMTEDLNHPAQVLCDVFTMYEKTGRTAGLNLAYVGDSSKGDPDKGIISAIICRDLLRISARMGINFCIASPKEYQIEEEPLREARQDAEKSGAKMAVTDDPKEAVAQADFIYTDTWSWYGMDEDEIKRRDKILKPKYQINSDLMKAAPPHAKFMHCLPALRGEEVTDEVMDSPQSIVFDEAENRMHTELALLVAFIGKKFALSPEARKTKENEYVSGINKILGKLP